MNRFAVASLIVAATLCGCSKPIDTVAAERDAALQRLQKSEAAKTARAEFSQLAKMKKATTWNLRDPSSAQFRNLKMLGVTLCGELNRKNLFGAYVGFERFFTFETVATTEGELQGIRDGQAKHTTDTAGIDDLIRQFNQDYSTCQRDGKGV